MARVESFELDHNIVKAPYIRIAGVETHETGAKISKFDLRFLQPNKDGFSTGAMHTLEHLLAINMRDHLKGIIDISPMGCRTGFYMIIWGSPSVEEVREVLVKVLHTVGETEVVPATTAKECGNFRDHSLFAAKIYASEVLSQGISLDPFKRIL
ncbi:MULTISPECIES: S-ribosylhomocysteine lyase [unclassified Gemella]|uniref:S-ribosylhomocysteine lyase n=1 Tax=unclassified Gemella TaxID=2624949 RepID=UPI0010742598|nr:MULTISPECIES: S-ribosylhomocysteine lyase [unclassified Gemella]MBF0710403.1 S-ribosylhomocysteine lyase [Gemella sp. GL1.1]MBF0747041.1 S-ribosylhomocysteine lyase [Gemella sp. 19428wG2_WT2a]NYS27747.1 S-ribosylhomocysteine lyase [Gemella sp. GL1]TFU58534.1 S-ribosylhomocysteine lyase [Gemella sp. WT2a]